MPHFELIRSAVKEIVESFPDRTIKLRRADEIADVGSVQETFILALQKADIVVAELSATGNANVYYELGIRFALRRAITIPIWQIGTKLPADLQGVLGIQYEPSNPVAQREQFYKFIRSRLSGQLIDSPVYKVLPNLQIANADEISALMVRVAQLERTLKESLLSDVIQQNWDEAESLLKKGDIGATLDTLGLAYAAAPRNVRLAVRYGQLLSRAERHDQAITVLQSAASIASEVAGPKFIPHRELGMAYKRAGKVQLAVDWLTKAVAENPRDSDTHGIIGGVHKDAYEIDQAIDSYERGFDSDAESTYCLLNFLCLLAVRRHTGDKLRLKRLLPQADKLTADIVTSAGADHWTVYDRAHVLLLAGKASEALSMFSMAIAGTATVGDLRSARKNIDLLVDAGTRLASLDKTQALFNVAETKLKN